MCWKAQQRARARYRVVDRSLIHIQPLGTVGMHAGPIALGESGFRALGNLAKLALKLDECPADFPSNNVGQPAG